jgi:hypothetical protein
MRYLKHKYLYAFTLFLFIAVTAGYSQEDVKLTKSVKDKLLKWKNPLTDWSHIGKIRLDSVRRKTGQAMLKLYYAPALSYYPLREENVIGMQTSVKSALGRKYRKYELEIYSNGFNIEQLVPNIYRRSFPIDSSRIHSPDPSEPILVRNLEAPIPSNGLYGRSIALWHSHGYFFEMTLDRWEWQRARLFGTVEDISVMGYVLPYLTEMLENAGANVFLPRERDTQINEVIVDNDKSTGNSEVVIHPSANPEKAGEGFLLTDTLFTGTNPFRNGTSVRIKNDSAIYVPDIPEDGDYAVSVSYPLLPGNSAGVRYTVYHSGGRSQYLVNQTIGGKTWIYLGKFHFRKGKNSSSGSVVIGSGIPDNGMIGLDAVRFGGGMGNVARRPSQEIIANQRSVNETADADKVNGSLPASQFRWKVSGKPRFVEGSRYWLQYAGMPDTMVFSPNSYRNDYNDDYQSRGMWVNYLMSSPSVSEGRQKGLGIPLDLSLAFHTDAGVTPNDSIIGTLAIYSTASDNGKFPDGSSRMASRDLSDIIQTQIINDLQLQYYPEWTRRGIWDRPYAEARRPNVPSMLLELLSHQNKADQRFGLDPRFRFAVSRAVYKGMVKYFSYVENRKLAIEPLAVTHFAITPLGGKRIILSWEPVIDSLEPSSVPVRYRIYKRSGDGGFDNGAIINTTSFETELDTYNMVYGFKVAALNEGGESFCSEVLSVGLTGGGDSPVLIVNGFDRICGPEWFDEGKMAGVAWWKDRGVADHYEISQVGDQYDFDRKSAWLDDDAPGWGASWADMEGKVIPGNTFDFSALHGRAILAAGRSFFSVSEEFFISGKFNPTGIKTLDLLFGEEKTTPAFIDPEKSDFKIYTPELMKRIETLSEAGANIFISGAYIGSDIYPVGDSSAFKFAKKYLHFTHRTAHAVNDGKAYATDYAYPEFTGTIGFNPGYSPAIYSVESPDAIEASGKGAKTIMRYTQNNTSAGVAYSGSNRTVAIGFPFETIKSENERNALMKQVLNFLEK